MTKKAYNTILSQGMSTGQYSNMPTRLRKRNKMKKGGVKTLKKVSKQLAKASKLHKAQSERISKLASKMKEGGYPKSDPKDFMKRMGYYEAGGLNTTTQMYGDNLMPGSSETSFLAYDEADPETLKKLEEDLEKQNLSTEEVDEAKAEIAANRQKVAMAEGTVQKGLKELGKTLQGPEEIVDEAGNIISTGMGVSDFSKDLIKTGKELYGAGTTPGITAAAPKGVISAVNPTTGGGMSLLPGSPIPEGFVVEGVSGGSGVSTALSKATSGLKTGLGNIATRTAGTAADKLGRGLTTSITGGSSMAAQLANPAMLASLAGMGIKRLSDDDDPTTFNAGEATGSILSGAGTGAGIGSMILPGVGTLAGAAIGGLYSGIKGLVGSRAAEKKVEKAEEEQDQRREDAFAKLRTERLKDKEVSGFDFGSDIARYGGLRYGHGGVKQLPGGIMKSIPGSDAVEFKGQSHEDGGIMVDEQTEVEGGETMDKVTMARKGGVKKDYFFSDHLKLNGKSFAQRHKDILAMGGLQSEIDNLAKLQEKKAGRDASKVKAKDGGVRKFEEGGMSMKPKSEAQGNIFRAWVNENYPDYAKEARLSPTGKLNKYVDRAWEKYGDEFTKSYGAGAKLEPKKVSLVPTELDKDPVLKMAWGPGHPDWVEGTSNLDAPPKKVSVPTLGYNDDNTISEKFKEDAQINRGLTEEERKALGKIYKDIPDAAIIGGAVQLLPSAYAFLRGKSEAEQMKTPGRLTAPSLQRVSLNQERSANESANRALNRFIETSGGGPANIIAKMAAYRTKQQGDMKIASAEAKANTAIANQEAQLKAQADARNVANQLTVDQVNTKLREANRLGEVDQRLAALDTASQNIAGLTGDYLSYKATEDLARATGDMGIYERQRLRQLMKGQINPTTGRPYTNADIADIFNINISEPVVQEVNTEETTT